MHRQRVKRFTRVTLFGSFDEQRADVGSREKSKHGRVESVDIRPLVSELEGEERLQIAEEQRVDIDVQTAELVQDEKSRRIANLSSLIGENSTHRRPERSAQRRFNLAQIVVEIE